MKLDELGGSSLAFSYEPLVGLVAAPYTPFHDNGSLNLAVLDKYVEHLVNDKVNGAFICGTTGEGVSLTIEERLQVAQRWMEAGKGKLRIVVQVGGTNLSDAKMLAAHAQRIGAAGISCLPPFYYKARDLETLIDYCGEVAQSAPALPFYYYHIPAMTNVEVCVHDLLASGGRRIKNLVGAKCSFDDLFDLGESIRLEEGRFNLLFGRDEMLLAALAVGAPGAIGSSYNTAAPLFHVVIEEFLRGDMQAAQAAQARANEFIAVLLAHGGMPAGKAAMKFLGVDCGPVRLPLRSLLFAQIEALEKALAPLQPKRK